MHFSKFEKRWFEHVTYNVTYNEIFEIETFPSSVVKISLNVLWSLKNKKQGQYDFFTFHILLIIIMMFEGQTDPNQKLHYEK